MALAGKAGLDLSHVCQKRPISVKRDLLVSKETYQYGCKTRPVTFSKVIMR